MDGGRGEPISFLSVEVPVMWCGAGREAVNAEFGAAELAALYMGLLVHQRSIRWDIYC